jgi:hypothetical protein
MTIAIGTLYSGGVIVCADSKVVASDGATTSDSKVTVLAGEKSGIFAVADAAEDAHAAKMLACEIRDAACKAANPRCPEKEIKSVMTEWHSSYGSAQPPHLQFILARVLPPYTRIDNGRIYLCEPPATVMDTTSIAVGRGSRVVDPLLRLLNEACRLEVNVKMTLVRLAFLMYRAKKDEGSACGGESYAVVISNRGALTYIHPAEMAMAENLAEQLDRLLFDMSAMITNGSQGPTENFLKRCEVLAADANNLKFPSLAHLEHLIRDYECGH